ncbi:phage minor head protein [Micromonospora sp. NPDC049645]|uniref:phage minor head protein n=1 Tax=Micromonospora sp. NPDC049645 TaxID=3155508 RepID=UPI00342354AF
MPLPSWYEPGDPHAGRRMRQLMALGAGEQQVRAGADAAIAEFLALARAGVLGSPTPGALTAAAGDDEPPDLGGWPTIEQWAAILRRSVLPPISLLFGEMFYAEARRAAIAVTGYVSEYMQTVFDRLVIWPVDAFDDVRAELQEGLTTGDDTRQLRERIGRVLGIDAPSRKLQAQIGELNRTIADPDTPPQVRREARARRAALYRRQDDEDRLWQWKAARIARTEALGAMNGGTYLGALAYAEASGETRFKQWWGTSDNRIRSSHWAVHMAVEPLAEPFTVGGFSLTRPGDPTGPGHEVINCRCTLLILNADEAARERERYARDRPNRTDIRGREMDDDGQPIGEPEVHQGYTPLNLTAAGDGSDQVTQPTDQGPPALPVGWRGRLAPFDVLSGDRRIIATPPGELRVRPLPIAFKWQESALWGHDGAVVVGAITKAWVEGGELWGSGPFDLAEPEGDGTRAARRLADGFAGTVSVDLDDVTGEYRVIDPDGKLIDPADVEALLVPDPMDPDWMTLPEGYSEAEVALDWRLMSTTLVADPAFAEARVFPVYDAAEIVSAAELVREREAEATGVDVGEPVDQAPDVALVAAAAPLAAPHAWFADPQFTGPTPMTVTDDGRVFGHAGVFDTCHIGFQGRCVPAPRGADYSRFHLKAYRTADAGDIAVGPLVMGTDHASTSTSTTAAMAMAHYANNGKCAAYVRAGEDEFGVWVAGVLDPGLTEVEQVRARAMTLSGDWRQMDGRIAFIAALAVNVPGFAVPRKTTGGDGQLVALVAAGALQPNRAAGRRVRRAAAGGPEVRVVVPDARAFAREVVDAMEDERRDRAAAAQLANRVYAGSVAQLANRVNRGR